MAELYLARATGIEGFEKLVALKRILPRYAEQEDFVRMFLDEARLTARIHHANVAAVHDIGRCDDGFFFAMEYVHGEDVRSVMCELTRRHRALPLEHAMAITIGAAAGLHAAHEQTDETGAAFGIVHRDVSPANLLVSYDGCLKLIDFGIAKAASRETETRAGTLKGKVAYMSPEQCLGDPLDRRSDVWSLGVVLYEITTGQRLFTVENEYTAMREIVDHDAPPPSRKKPGYPPELEAIVMRALRRDRNERFGSAQEVQLALEAFVRARGLAVSNVQLAHFMRELFPERAALPAGGRTLPLRPTLTPIPIDLLPERAPTLEPLILGESGPAANDELALPFEEAPPPPLALTPNPEAAIDTAMFPPEPSVSITVEPMELAPRRAPATARWHLPLLVALAASVSAVIGAVAVMTARSWSRTEPATVSIPPAPAPSPTLQPDPTPAPPTAPVEVAAPPTPAPAIVPMDPIAPPAPPPARRTHRSKAKKSSPSKPAKPAPKPTARWNADSALPPS